tara:strand:- start:552 stop:881 length:330 start_codon:yes stop_codon:yes gene_type:complete
LKPYSEVQIKNLSDEDKISLSGILVNVTGSSFVLDDGTGQVTVLGDENQIKELKPNSFLRVMGMKIPSQDNTMNAEIIQDLSGIDKYLYNKVRNALFNGKKEEQSETST